MDIISDAIKASVNALLDVGRRHPDPAEAHKIFRECQRLKDAAESVNIIENIQWEPLEIEDDEEDNGEDEEEEREEDVYPRYSDARV